MAVRSKGDDKCLSQIEIQKKQAHRLQSSITIVIISSQLPTCYLTFLTELDLELELDLDLDFVIYARIVSKQPM